MSQMGASPPRLELPEPIAATLLETDATIVEVSLVGCSVHHPTRVKVGATVTLQFVWQGKKARVDAKVARSTMQFSGGKPLYVSGLQFADTIDQAPPVIRSIVESLLNQPAPALPPAAAPAPAPAHVAPPPALPKAAAPPPPPAPKPVTPPPPISYEQHKNVPFLRFDDDFDEVEPEGAPAIAVAEAEPIFLRCVFVDGRWKNERVSDGSQPDQEGFTVLADTDDVDGLCRTYEVADPETRKMMRFSFEIANEQQQRA